MAQRRSGCPGCDNGTHDPLTGCQSIVPTARRRAPPAFPAKAKTLRGLHYEGSHLRGGRIRNNEPQPLHPSVDPNWMGGLALCQDAGSRDRWWDARHAEMKGDTVMDDSMVRALYPEVHREGVVYKMMPTETSDPGKILRVSDVEELWLQGNWAEMVAQDLGKIMPFENLDEPSPGPSREERQATKAQSFMIELPFRGGHKIEPRRKSHMVRLTEHRHREALKQEAEDAARAEAEAVRTAGDAPVGRQSLLVPVESAQPASQDRLGEWLSGQVDRWVAGTSGTEFESESSCDGEERTESFRQRRLRKLGFI